MSQLKFTLVQTNLHWEDKEANLDMLAKKIHGIKEPTHVVVLLQIANANKWAGHRL